MKKLILLAAFLLLISKISLAQKVANYSIGKYGTDEYEKFSFWVNDDKRAEIFYVYGKDEKQLMLTYVGPVMVKGTEGFKVRFPNNHTYTIVPDALNLKITDSGSRYNKTFTWAYEGPVDGVGTHCAECAESDVDAFKLLETYYVK
jgi:hypothetical protein